MARKDPGLVFDIKRYLICAALGRVAVAPFPGIQMIGHVDFDPQRDILSRRCACFRCGCFLRGRFVLRHGQVAVIYIFLCKIVKNQRL